MISAIKKCCNKSNLLLALCVMLTCLGQSHAVELYSEKDLQIAARTFSFIEGLGKSELVVGIIYNPDSPDSVADKDNLAKIIGNGVKAAKVTLTYKSISAKQLSDLAGVDIAYFTIGLSDRYNESFNATKEKKILSFSKDPSCVNLQKCVLTASSDPTVKIVVSRQAADQSGVNFAQALRLMIHEQQ